jgi:hypothetical protein
MWAKTIAALGAVRGVLLTILVFVAGIGGFYGGRLSCSMEIPGLMMFLDTALEEHTETLLANERWYVKTLQEIEDRELSCTIDGDTALLLNGGDDRVFFLWPKKEQAVQSAEESDK